MYKGILYLLAATFTFSLVNLGVKLLSHPNDVVPGTQAYPVHELVFFRSVISLSICMTIVRWRGIPFFGVNHRWLLIRGLSGATGLFMLFMTIQHMPLAIATTIQYLSPVFTIVLAIFLLGERVKMIQWLFFLISLGGAVVISYDPTNTEAVNPWWILIGIVSAFFSGLAYNAIMKCRTTDHPVTVVMYFPLVASPVMLVLCFTSGFVVPRGIEWVLLLLIGLLTQIAQVCMTRAFNADSASTVAPLKYLGSIYAALMGFYLFHETLGLISSLGIGMIILGVLLNTWFKKRKEIRALPV